MWYRSRRRRPASHWYKRGSGSGIFPIPPCPIVVDGPSCHQHRLSWLKSRFQWWPKRRRKRSKRKYNTYLILHIERVRRESEDDRGFPDWLISQENDLVFHLRCWITCCFTCHVITHLLFLLQFEWSLLGIYYKYKYIKIISKSWGFGVLGASSNAARRRCPAAPSDLPKSGGGAAAPPPPTLRHAWYPCMGIKKVKSKKKKTLLLIGFEPA